MGIPFNELKKNWESDAAYRKAYDELKPEYKLARSLIEARKRAGLTQSQLAKKMNTSQPTVARLESGCKPNLKTLERYARAVGAKVMIYLVPEDAQQETLPAKA